MYNRLFLTLSISCICLFYSCHTFSQSFDEVKTKILFDKFNKQTKTPFSFKVLNDFLLNVKIEELKKGKIFQKEVLFEKFKNDCIDILELSYDEPTKSFILKVNEATFVKELDWCPEHTYLGSFKIINNKIMNTDFKLVAG